MAEWVRHPDVVYTDLEDGAVLLHLTTKLYYSLNASAQAIWQGLESATSDGDLSRAVALHYGVPEPQVQPSVARFVQALARAQLIAPATADGRAGAPSGSTRMGSTAAKATGRFTEPELVQHDEPLHDVVGHPFDPQLPLAE
jgi:coenzyme PQQ synthesis protein D (PqqD)